MTVSPTSTSALLGGTSTPKSTKTTGYATFPDKPPDAKPSWFSQLFFGSAQSLLRVGVQRQLDMNDLHVVDHENTSSVASQAFKQAYLRHQRSIFRAMIATYGTRFLLCGLGSLVVTMCAVFSSIVLQQVIEAFSSPVIDLVDLSWWVGAFFLSRLVNAFCNVHVTYNIEIALVRITVSLKSLFFEKTVRRSLQSKLHLDMDVADVSNLFTADMEDITYAGQQIVFLWVTPIQIAVVIYLLYRLIGAAAFAGLGVILLSLVANYYVAKGYMGAYNDMKTTKDRRMGVVKEVFGAIQVLKLNAWERNALERIRIWRADELHAVARYMYLIGFATFIFWATPMAVTSVSFVVYAVVLREQLTATKVFVAMILYNSLRNPLTRFPDAIQAILQAHNALQRMSKYLDTDEVHEDRITRDPTNYLSEVMISVENAKFAWKPSELPVTDTNYVLQDVNLQVREGDFVVIHGPVGAGKSSLIAAILGELPRTTGNVFVRTHKVAYYSQQPWIQHLTIRDNILFGLPFDAKKYDRVIDVCGLTKDLEQFPAGDMTEIGQKGVNLSGGQKARVSLARACYSDADIFILDSPLAAVDAVVQSEIFNKCLCGLLEKKTVLLVTHLHDVIESEAVDMKISVSSGGIVSVKRTHHELPRSTRRFKGSMMPVTQNEDGKASEVSLEKIYSDVDGTLVEDEAREEGRVNRGVFMAYIEASGGWRMGASLIVVLVLWQCLQVKSDLYLAQWTSGGSNAYSIQEVKHTMTNYVFLSIGAGAFVFVRCVLVPYIGVRASRVLFDAMTTSLLHAPLRFFDANPIGRILNRYAEDIAQIDFELSFKVTGIAVNIVIMLFQLTTATYVIQNAALFFIPLALVYTVIGLRYLATTREVSRLLKVSTSPILSHLSQADDGVTVIRAFGPQYIEHTVRENSARLDTNTKVWLSDLIVNQWFGLRVQLIGVGVIVIVVSALVMLRDHLNPGLVGLAFMYAVSIDSDLAYMVLIWSWLEVSMISPERVQEYIEIRPEGRDGICTMVSPAWPQTGSIAFDNVVFTYKPGGDPVLKGLSFSIQHNEKIGIVGRTGAGKSSLTMALFRINELESGRIVIDGQDISTINLHTLRSRMSIIPQVPVLFKGPLRAYMDPFNAYTDADIWQAFDKIGLKDMISALDGKLDHELSENGENFSVGERQMLCLARALLRQSRVVVMDEATASIDLATEQKLQSMIQREFVDATVLTIAHRLATVLDSDRILVLSDGRMVEFDTPQRLAQREGGVFRELAQESGHLAQLLQ
ncbi:hypothetical protein Poli38472_001290 [Pythium oligandrum]|uniref:Uncharacterized protein n=1 Tax=Pythium oligandrum TaxID=41045 RepID=A0A8K1FQ78_PYTOL|nr:hypothetical protein Poli38472_001290 [Pythium oligandrum]|eukprot:TMW69134.1 hypothetical protein Poli38472_001290 [Pythium oligandrum]